MNNIEEYIGIPEICDAQNFQLSIYNFLIEESE